MIRRIAAGVYRKIRESGGLSKGDVAKEVGLQRQTIWRWESKKEALLPKREQEEILVKAAKLTRLRFGEIMCEVLSEFLGRRVTMAPPADYIPSMPLARAARRYSLRRDLLDQEDQDAIEEMLAEARNLELAAEQICRAHAKRIERLIEKAEAAAGRSPLSGGDD